MLYSTAINKIHKPFTLMHNYFYLCSRLSFAFQRVALNVCARHIAEAVCSLNRSGYIKLYRSLLSIPFR